MSASEERPICGAPCHYGGLSMARRSSRSDLGWMWHCNRRVRVAGERWLAAPRRRAGRRMTAAEWVLFVGVCDVDDCLEVARWTQNRDRAVGSESAETKVDCPTHPHRPPMHALHAYLRRIG